jgi:hypothetical protein
MKGIAVKYGLVIGIFTSVVALLLCWIVPNVAAGLTIYAIAFGVAFGLTLFYNITKKRELADNETIAYHEAFINSMIIALVGLIIFSTSFMLLKGAVFKEIPQISKNETLKRYDKTIEYYKTRLEVEGSQAAEMIVDLNNGRKKIETQNFNPMHKDNIGNSVLSIFLMAGVAGAFISIITSFLGTRSKPIISA